MISPEHDITVYVAKAPIDEPKNVLTSIWAEINPDFKYAVLMCSEILVDDGWCKSWGITYDIPASEGRMILANCHQYRDEMFVSILDASMGGLSRRGTQIGEIIMSWKPNELQGVSLSERTIKEWSKEDSHAFEGLISKAMKELCIPGAAVAVIAKDKVLFKKAFGVKDTRTGESVTEDTLFKIGSTTKALTTLLMAKLVEEGKFNWNDPVTKYLPYFKLSDKEATDRMTLRNCVSSSSGMPRQDAELLIKYKRSAEDRVRELSDMAPTTKQGEVFQYSNPMVSLAGYAAARSVESGGTLLDAYCKVMKEKVFDPLGMTTAAVRLSDTDPFKRASPHGYLLDMAPGGFDVELDEFTEAVAPAGNGWCALSDLIKYVQMELENGSSYIRCENLLERRKPLMKITRDSDYGHCLFNERKHGIEIFGHNGSTTGFCCEMMFVPEYDIGLVVLVNSTRGSTIFPAVRAKMFEILLDGPKQAENIIEMAAKATDQSYEAFAAKISQDPSEVEKVVGQLLGKNLSSPQLGDFKVERVGKDFLVKLGDLVAKIAVIKGEEPMFLTFDLHMSFFMFKIKPDNKVVMEMGQQTYIFD